MEKRQTPQQNMRNVRAIALDILLQVMEEGKYCDRTLHRTLNREDTLSKQQRAFLTRLVEGTVEQAIRLDYIIDCFSKTKVVKMKPVIRETLRMAVYQLFYMDQVPDSAACNEAVKLVRKRGLKGLSGFVNGVLRSVIRGKDQIKYPDAKDFISYASIKYSMPGWIIEYFLEEYSEAETEQILQGFMQKESGVTVRCNLNLQNPSGNPDLAVPEIIESLERQQVTVQPGKWFPYALHLSGFERVDSMEAFVRGRLQVQDESSMLVGAVSGIKPGQEVLDVCAAPGGKSLHAADLLAGTGVIFSCDLSETKVHLIQENMERAGVDHCELYRQNARILRKDWIDSVDVLIADLPCSGLGVIGGKCDIKYHTHRPVIRTDTRTLRCRNMGIIKNNRKFAGLQVTVHLFNVGFINTYSTCNPQISCYTNMDFSINIKEIFTAFMVLFAVIDITGSTPIIIGLNDAGKKVSAEKAAGISLVIFIAFLFAGDGLLKLFNIDISSFALAGALVLFVLAIEMTFSIEIFRNDGPEGSATIVPVIFPLIAGAGALATTLTLKAECSVFSIIIAILLNMTVVYIVLRNVYLVERILGKGGVYILRKFFGIILLAMSVKIFASNLNTLLASLS